jgi:hypothetical protein
MTPLRALFSCSNAIVRQLKKCDIAIVDGAIVEETIVRAKEVRHQKSKEFLRNDSMKYASIGGMI